MVILLLSSHFDLSEIIAFASYLPVTPAMQHQQAEAAHYPWITLPRADLDHIADVPAAAGGRVDAVVRLHQCPGPGG